MVTSAERRPALARVPAAYLFKMPGCVRDAMRARQYRLRAEEACLHWIRRLSFFQPKHRSAEMGALQINSFLPHLALLGNVAIFTQNQALSAVLSLSQVVPEKHLDPVDGIVLRQENEEAGCAAHPRAVRAMPQEMYSAPKLAALLLHGRGLRLREERQFQGRDIDFALN